MDLVIDWVRNGLTSASDIASEIGLSKGAVSKLAQRAINDRLLVKKGREYALP
jgi:predicted transcriptional regulator